MNYKKIFILVIILIIAVAAVWFSYGYKKPTVKIENKTLAIAVSDVKILDNTKPFKIDIVYPQISGQDEFNKTVQDIINKEISDFKTNSLENDKAVKDTDPKGYAEYPREYDLDIGYDNGLIDENTISVVINIYNFEGGAHGASYSEAVNFNPQIKKEVKLSDLFPGNPDYLKTISNFAVKNLTKQIDPQMIDSSWLNTGAGPTEENYSVFLINKNDITFYIQQYQVAAGAAGSFKVIFPR